MQYIKHRGFRRAQLTRAKRVVTDRSPAPSSGRGISVIAFELPIRGPDRLCSVAKRGTTTDPDQEPSNMPQTKPKAVVSNSGVVAAVRGIALTATQGLARGMPVEGISAPMKASAGWPF